ncbi:alpha-amylase [Priestia megaterium]|nr:alpha-amylase [Priestia megaterium]
MVNRFYNGDEQNDYDVVYDDPEGFYGGDLLGVAKKLDYLKDMGFTTICLTPIMKNDKQGYHGYAVTDHFKVDSHLGTVADMKYLVKEAHKRGIKVVLEFPFTVSATHPWLAEKEKEQWIKRNQYHKDFSLNLSKREVQIYIMDVAAWWVSKTNIDGYYLTDIDHLSSAFLHTFSTELKRNHQSFYLIGETASIKDNKLKAYSPLDLVVSQSMSQLISDTFSQTNQTQQSVYKQAIDAKNLNIGHSLDNVRTVRFTRKALNKNEHPGARTKQALSYLYTTSFVPVVYYGTEIALDGGKGADNHRMMDFRANPEIIDYIKKISALRTELPSLRKGTVDLLIEDHGASIYKRTYKDETTIVAINNTDKTAELNVSTEKVGANSELRGMLNEEIIRSVDGKYKIILTPEMTNVYRVVKDSGLNIGYISMLAFVYISFGLFIYRASRKKKKLNNEIDH